MGELASLSDFADAQFSQSDFEPAVLAGRPGEPAFERAVFVGRPGVAAFQPVLAVKSRSQAGTFEPTALVDSSQAGTFEFEPTVLASGTQLGTFEPIVLADRPHVGTSEPVMLVHRPHVGSLEPRVVAGTPGATAVEPRVVRGSAAPSAAEPQPAAYQPATVPSGPLREVTHASFVESQTAALNPRLRIPDRQLNPMAVNCAGIAPGRAKPIPVFGPTPTGTGTVQVPQPTGLPLRPVMVLAKITASVAATPVAALKTELSIKPELQQSTIAAALSSELNLGLPELPMDASAGPLASPTSKIVAALAGVAMLGAGLFFFAGRHSDAGSKSPAPAPPLRNRAANG